MGKRRTTLLATVAVLAVLGPASAMAKGSGPASSGQDVLSVTSATGTVTEGGAPLSVTATRSSDIKCAFSVDYTTKDGSATAADNDYTPVSGTLNFIAGQRVSSPVAISAPDNQVIDPAESFTWVLSNVHNVTCPSGTKVVLKGATDTISVVDTDDPDADGVATYQDNCPTIANPSQTDADNDHVGDACDTTGMTNSVNGGAYTHSYNIAYDANFCGNGLFTGVGQSGDGHPETISGHISYAATEVDYTSTYTDNAYSYSAVANNLDPSAGTYSGTGTNGVDTVSGTFTGLPVC